MIPAALAILVWLPAILGFGAWWPSRGGPLWRLAISGMMGLATMSALAVAMHLAIPITPAVAATALLVGWGALALGARRLLGGVRLGHVLAVTVMVLVLAAATQMPARHYDAGLYQLQTVKWIREYAQVRGIASLHARLAFNSSWFALAALVETPWLVGRSAFFLEAFPVLFTLLASAEALERFRAGERTCSNAYFVLASFAAFHGMDVLGSLSTDSPTIIAAVFSLGLMLRAFEDRRALAWASSTGLLLSAFALTVKISSVVLTAAWVVVVVAKRGELARRQRVLALAGTCALILPWTAHGLLASACALFPVVSSCFPELPWAPPLSVAANMNEIIRSWARWPGIAPGLAPRGWGWLPAWSRGLARSPHTCIPIVAGAFGVLWARGRLLLSPARIPLMVALAGMVFWFASAPAPRFGLAFLLPITLIPLATGAAAEWEALRARARTALITLGVAAALSFTWWSIRPLRKLRPATYALLSWPAFPSPVLEQRVTIPGTRVWVPSSGDKCWDAPLPCTPDYDPSLEWSGDAWLVYVGRKR